MSNQNIKKFIIGELHIGTLNIAFNGGEKKKEKQHASNGFLDMLVKAAEEQATDAKIRDLEETLAAARDSNEDKPHAYTTPTDPVAVSINWGEKTPTDDPASGVSADIVKVTDEAEVEAVISPVARLPKDGLIGEHVSADFTVTEDRVLADITPVDDDDDDFEDDDDDFEDDDDEDDDDFEEDDDDEDSEEPPADVDGEDAEEAEQDGDDEGHDLPSATITPVSRGSADITLERTSGVTAEIRPATDNDPITGELSDDAEVRPGNMTQEDIDSINAEFDRVADTESAERADEEAAAVASAAESVALGVESESLDETTDDGVESETMQPTTSDVHASFQRI